MTKHKAPKLSERQSLSAMDWNDVLSHLQNFATSLSANEELSRTSPLPQQEAERSFDEIAQFQEVLKAGERPFMESLDVFGGWFSRLEKKAVLKTIEFKDLRHFLVEALTLKEVLKPHKLTGVQNFYEDLLDAQAPLSAIDHVMTPSGEIRNDASEKLYKLFNEEKQIQQKLNSTLNGFVKTHEMDHLLQDKFVTNREGRWVLPIKSNLQSQFDGIIHGSSQSKQTVFMEPQEIVPLNNRLRQVEVEIQEEIELILTELSEYFYHLREKVKLAQEILFETDIRFAQAQLATRLKALPVEFSEGHIQLNELRHPLLTLASESSAQKVIPNDVEMNAEKQILLLSGPNAGGKTVLLKSIGLAAQMARCGLPVCAAISSSLPYFKEILISIGDEQSVDENLSTFAAHLKTLNQALNLNGSKSLVLIDEICGSTDPEEGSALARSFIEAYESQGVFGVITSHLSPLKVGWSEDSKVVNGSLEYDMTTGRPTYQFLPGVPGLSQAIQTAKRTGVEGGIIERAYELLTPEARAQREKLDDIEKIREELLQLKQTYLQEKATAARNKDKYKKLMRDFEKEKEQWLQRSVKKAEKKVDEMITHAKVHDVFQRHEKLQQIKTEFPKVVRSQKTDSSGPETSEEFAKLYPTGSVVFVPSLNKDGIIQSTPNQKGEVTVQAGSIRLQLPWKQIQVAQKPQNPTARVARQQGFSWGLQTGDRTIDLRGQRVEEALENLESQLDAATHSQEDRVKIIHGHGTEALKRAVRSHLSRSTYVQSWKSGGKDSGGDGVTWASLGVDL